MAKYKIVITDYYYASQEAENRAYATLDGDVEVVDLTKLAPGGLFRPEEIIPHVQDCDALVTQFATINADVIHAMKRCRVISRYAIGVDNIDIEAATAQHISVANVPDYCIDEVSNTAAAHLLNAMRKLGLARDRLLNGTFEMNAILPIRRISHCTLCLLGFGHIARALAVKMKPFFGKIVAYDPYFQDRAAWPDVEFRDEIHAAVADADAISVHVPLNSATRGLVNADVLAAAKDGVVVVNTARGGVIDEAALIAALDSGKVMHAGLDVIDGEDFSKSPYLHHPKVTLTPHFGWCSEEAVQELQRKVAENVVSCLKKGEPVYHVNRW